MDAYKQGSDEWRKALGKAAATRQEFAALFGSGSQASVPASDPPADLPHTQQAPHEAAAAAADDVNGTDEQDDSGDDLSSPEDAGAVAPAVQQPPKAAANGAPAGKPKSKRKRLEADTGLAKPSAEGPAANGSHKRSRGAAEQLGVVSYAKQESKASEGGEKVVRRTGRGKGHAARQKAAKKAAKAAKVAASAQETGIPDSRPTHHSQSKAEPEQSDVQQPAKMRKKQKASAAASAGCSDHAEACMPDGSPAKARKKLKGAAASVAAAEPVVESQPSHPDALAAGAPAHPQQEDKIQKKKKKLKESKGKGDDEPASASRMQAAAAKQMSTQAVGLLKVIEDRTPSKTKPLLA